MIAVIALILILALFSGIGFAAHDVLWFVLGVLLVLWLAGFVAHGAERRWYRW